MATMNDLAQVYIDAGLTPPARFVGNNTLVTEADMANTQTYVGAQSGTTTTDVEATTSGTGGLTTEQVEAIFASMGQDPDVNFDGTPRVGGAAGVASRFNSEAELRRVLATHPDYQGVTGTMTESQVRAVFAEFGLDPDVHFSGTYEEGRAARIAASGMTAEALRATLASAPQDIDRLFGQDLFNVGGLPEVWKVGDNEYLVYTVPGTENDPVYISWEVFSEADLESYFGPDQPVVFSRILTQGEWDREGALVFGDANEIQNLSDNPFTTWANDMARLAETQPWILEPDYQALAAMAIMEGREITEDELATTNWWQTHNAAQRQWMLLLSGDPASAQQAIDAATIQITEQLRLAGGGQSVDPAVIDWLVMEMVQGNITQADVALQVRALTDPYSGIDLLPGLKGISGVPPGGATATVNQEQNVRNLLHTWLGPMFGQWSDSEIDRIAGSFRNDPNAESQFIESLKDQRMVLLPEYQDRNISYQAIANTWKQWWMGQWGQAPDETSGLWLEVLRNNDTGESGEKLRRVGLEQGVNKVIDDVNSAALTPTTGLLRSPV